MIKLPSDWIVPDWNGFCFSHIPGTVERLLTGDTSRSALPASISVYGNEVIDRVIVLVVDAFGWRFIDSHLAGTVPLLWQTLEKEAVITKLTSLFPSTTTGCLSSLHQGIPPRESGLYEWYSYDPIVDRIISPFLFSIAAGDKRRDTLNPLGFNGEQIFLQRSFYKDLAEKGIQSYVLQYKDYAHGAFSEAALGGSTIYGHSGWDDALEFLVNSLKTGPQKGYWVVYTDTFDTVCHQRGPGSSELLSDASKIFSSLQKTLSSLRGMPGKNLLIVTADHGHIEMDSAKTIFLDKEFPVIKNYIRSNKDGIPLVPAGSGRDFFLSIKEDVLVEAKELLTEFLRDKASVFIVDELIEAGIFGSPVTERFRERVGDIVILTLGDHSVWWSEEGKFRYNRYGDHGGMTRQEMEVPFIALAL